MRGPAESAVRPMAVTTPPLARIAVLPTPYRLCAGDEKMVEEAVTLLERLVSFDTTSRRSNLPLIRWVEAWLAAHGVESRVTLGAAGGEGDPHAGGGPRGAGGVALSARGGCGAGGG